jgi:transcriptional regulator of arginine metabolism
MIKNRDLRLNMIKVILDKEDIHSQIELRKKLKEKGIDTTQATISRDLKDLGYSRAPVGDGSYCLVKVEGRDEHIEILFKLGLEEIIQVENFIVIKTRPGNAQSVAGAIDRTHVEGILGTVAGDDTIFAITKNETDAHRVTKNLKRYLE